MIKRIINYFLEVRINLGTRKKLVRIGRNISAKKVKNSDRKGYKERWRKLGNPCSVLYPAYFGSTSGIESSIYTPENLYYSKIEPVLNNKAFALAYSDKNFYEKYLAEYKSLFPFTAIRGINGVLFDTNYQRISVPGDLKFKLKNNITYILKPSTETGGGENVAILTIEMGKVIVGNRIFSNYIDFERFLLNDYKGNFVLQERIEQHNWFKEFNSSSLNSVRLFSYRSVSDERVIPLHSLVRFGRPGSIVDNQAAGGFTCGISANGRLNDFACEKYGIIHRDLTFIADKAGTEVPFISEMKKIAIEIAPYFRFHRLLGFDFCVDKNNQVRLLEINCKNIETNFLQMNNGPLFGDFTDEIIGYCRTHKKSIVLDFYV
jgi:Sugar-transfer associated ATP-grasp